jgi:decaprenylphospho-beta-D-erythro-pentofuranosid-2-ulose 2-reductase
MSNILVFGATSAIAEAVCRVWAEDGHSLFLVARHSERLELISKDLRVRGAVIVDFEKFDAALFESHERIISYAFNVMGKIDIVLIAHGSLPDQQSCQEDFSLVKNAFDVNCLSVISVLNHLANKFESQCSGTIAVISSVAGDRGKSSNYVYGAAKGAVSIYLEGLRARLFHVGVSVTTIKPGFIDTPMTADFKKGLLWVQPERIARQIADGIYRKKDVIYVPGFWYFIMIIFNLIPEFLYKRFKM